MNSALIVVDEQIDFCEGGALPVQGGNQVCHATNMFLEREPSKIQFVAFTKDWHIEPGDHFSDTPDYVDTWPPHCVANTEGAQINQSIILGANSYTTNEVFYKGMRHASYTGFDGVRFMANAPQTLNQWLKNMAVGRVYICGLALDYCVKATALDAVEYGYETILIRDLTAPVSYETGEKAKDELLAAGVIFAHSQEV